MVDNKTDTRQAISIREYGDLSSDCTISAGKTAAGTFFLGILGARLAFRLLDKIVRTNTHTKVLCSIVGGTAICIYAAEQVKINCDKKLTEKYIAKRDILEMSE